MPEIFSSSSAACAASTRVVGCVQRRNGDLAAGTGGRI